MNKPGGPSVLSGFRRRRSTPEGPCRRLLSLSCLHCGWSQREGGTGEDQV